MIKLIPPILIEKRDELVRAAADLEYRARRIRADIAHLDATIRLFEPKAKLGSSVPPKRTHERMQMFKGGEISRRCLDAIRLASEPIMTAEIVDQTMADKGVDPDDEASRREITARFRMALMRLAKEGVVRKTGRADSARWSAVE